MGNRRTRHKGRQTRQNEQRTRQIQERRNSQNENSELVKFIIENQGKEYGSFEIFVRAANAVPTRTPHSLYQQQKNFLNHFYYRLGEDFIIVRDEQGLIDKFGIHPETLAVQFNQLDLAQEAEVRGPDAGSNGLFEIIALLIGSLKPNDVDYDSINNVFDRLVEIYWHAETQPTRLFRRVTQEQLEATVRVFLINFDAPIQENEATVAFNGETLRHLQIVHDSLEDLVEDREQQLLGAIATASNGRIEGWRDGNKVYPNFKFPTMHIKEIIRTIFAALQQE
ncbi:hypothetical protein CAEBREN_21082 [Caenorhabditis brenneri]|uniref:Uncharacterized protein n=1 Tax=Caenorhabditis brenneri TaxID=135651 RepID=G0MUZ9_CAEBE|nr:hypothetical protein CAEBREN_21082 [Caenorhabditis brenneri]